jgi:hypothetical protein
MVNPYVDELSTEALAAIAKACLHLLDSPDEWIHRRIDRFVISDHSTARHQTSVDFTIPAGTRPITVHDGQAMYVAPLFLLNKQHPRAQADAKGRIIPTAPYTDIDLLDEHGTRLSLLTQKQGVRIAGIMLMEAAAQSEMTVTPKLEDQLADIAVLDTLKRRPALEGVFDQTAEAEREELSNSEAFRKFRELAYMFSVYSPVIGFFNERPKNRLVKLVYDEPTNVISKPKGWIRRGLGVKAEQYFVGLPEIGAAQSHHVEIEVPSELEVNAVGLIGRRYEEFAMPDGKKSDAGPDDFYVRQIGCNPIGSIYMPSPQGRRVGSAWVKLRTRRNGFVLGALVASGIIALVLGLFTLVEPALIRGERPEGTVAVLLLVPALLAAFVANPSEHSLTARLLLFARFALVINGLLPFGAAVLLLTASEYTKPVSATPNDVAGQYTAVLVCTRQGRHGLRCKSASQKWVIAARALKASGLNPSDAHKEDKPFLETLRGRWLMLTGVSVLFVLLFFFSYLLPRPRGRSYYQIEKIPRRRPSS